MDDDFERQPHTVITSDTDNATLIFPEEAPPDKQALFRRLRSYNRGTWNGPKRENKSCTHRQDDLHRFDAIASSVELTPHQKERGRVLFDRLDLGKFSHGIDAVAFAVCLLIANKGHTRYWPHPQADRGGPFADFAEQTLDLDINEQMSLLNRVRSRIDAHDI